MSSITIQGGTVQHGNAYAKAWAIVNVGNIDSDGDVAVTTDIYFEFRTYWSDNDKTKNVWTRNPLVVTFAGQEILNYAYGGTYYSDVNGVSETYHKASTSTVYVNVGKAGGYFSANLSCSSVKYRDRYSTTVYTSGSFSGAETVSLSAYSPPAEKSTLSLGSSSVTLGNSLAFTVTKHGEVSTTNKISWSCGGSSGYTGLTTSGNYMVSLNTFEPLITNANKGTITFTLETYSGGNLVGTDSKSVTAIIPNNYLPVLKYSSITYIDEENERLIANKSKFTLYYDTSLTPSSNHATISNVVIKSVTSSNPSVTTSLFTLNKTDKTITSGVLPTWSGHPSYTITFVLTVTDSRGNSVDTTITNSALNVYCYLPPLVTIQELYRCDAQGTQSSSGTYAKIKVKAEDTTSPYGATISIGESKVFNITQEFMNEKGTDNWYYEDVLGFGQLDIGTQYEVELKYQSTAMYNYGDLPFVYNQLLPTMIMPISLLDDGTMVATSFGEMAQHYDDVNSSVVTNYAKGAELRATNSDGDIKVIDAHELLSTKDWAQSEIIETRMSELKIKAMSEDDYERLAEKDSDTLYFLY